MKKNCSLQTTVHSSVWSTEGQIAFSVQSDCARVWLKPDLVHLGCQMFWSAPKCNCRVLTWLKDHTKEDEAAWLNSSGLNTAYVKRLPGSHALTSLSTDAYVVWLQCEHGSSLILTLLGSEPKFAACYRLQAAFWTCELLTDEAEVRAQQLKRCGFECALKNTWFRKVGLQVTKKHCFKMILHSYYTSEFTSFRSA